MGYYKDVGAEFISARSDIESVIRKNVTYGIRTHTEVPHTRFYKICGLKN